MEYKIFALIGKAGSGKDTLINTIVARYPERFNKIIRATTRPRREYEKDGVDYWFMNLHPDFNDYEVLTGSRYNDWIYYAFFKHLDKNKINIGVFNVQEIKQLKKLGNVTFFYIDASDKVRLLRQLNRENNPNVKEIIRRFNADDEEFKDLPDMPYIHIRNDDTVIANAINSILGQAF